MLLQQKVETSKIRLEVEIYKQTKLSREKFSRSQVLHLLEQYIISTNLVLAKSFSSNILTKVEELIDFDFEMNGTLLKLPLLRNLSNG